MDPHPDPSARAAGRRVEQAKESLRSHLEELGRRFKDARNTVDIEAQIAAHPVPAVAIAFALGALMGARRKTVKPDATQRGLGGAMFAGVGAIALRLAKDLALKQVSNAAKRWIDLRQGESSVRSERVTSRDGSAEPFFDH